MPRANSISRFLGDRMQTRASSRTDRILGLEIFYSGFSASNLDDGSVRVEYLIQNRRNGRRVPPDEKTERVDRRKALDRYAELLRERFTVEMKAEDDWTYLVVR